MNDIIFLVIAGFIMIVGITSIYIKYKREQ